MSNLTAVLDNFLQGGHSGYTEARQVAKATQHLSVYRVKDFELVRVCSLDEFRVVVSMAGMLMAVCAFEARQLATGSDFVWRSAAELSTVHAAQTLVSQGNHPLLVETAIDLWDRGDWPEDSRWLPGYRGAMEGYGRLACACWTQGAHFVDLSEHGVSSVYPRTMQALKRFKKCGVPVEHEELITDVLGVMPQAWHLHFLNM